MRKIILFLLFVPFFSFSQSSMNMNLLGSLNYSNTNCSDIWGWEDGLGNEYALVGLVNGFSCVNVTNPISPIEEFFISDLNSTWRDIKTWGNYAYVTTEANAGLLIVDLTDMTGNTYSHVTQFTNNSGGSLSFTSSHNIYIDENGIVYIFGAKNNGSYVSNGGAIFLDADANSTNPVYLGEWDDYYIHDGMARGDTMYAGCIYEGKMFIVDVSNKSNPQTLASATTPNSFTHNAWVSDDGDYVFTTDETSDAYLTAYDISDINNIQEVYRIQSNSGSNSIPHNTHVDGNFLITSYYRDGTTVHDITYPNYMIQVAYYDSYAGSGNGFNGCWGTYPFLSSGNIISSDRDSGPGGKGRLLIYGRDFHQACYLQGNVTDGVTSSAISNASIEILSTSITENTNLLGSYQTASVDSGTFQAIFSAPGYSSDTLIVSLSHGVMTILDVTLYSSSVVPGCTNPIACNYDPSAITDDGSCVLQDNPISTMSAYNYTLSFHWGCSGNTYSAEMEFDSTANGVVNPGTFGATNITWSLCDSVLTWVYSDGTQYTSTSYNNGTFTGTMLSGSGSWTGCFTLTPIIAGCLDSTSLLYNPQANVDDGSCCANYLRLNMYSSWPGGWSGGIYWTMMDDNGDTVISTALTYNSSTDTYHNVDYICIPDGCYTIVCSNGGGSGGISWTLKDDSTNSTIVSGGCPFGPYITAIGTSCVIMGCTDPNANNYYPHANLDDGSCTYSCGPITGVYMSDIIHDRATFNWDNMNSPYCQVDQIRIRYREVGTSSWSTKTMGVPLGSGCNTSNTSKRILSLSANTTYEYKFKIWYCNASTVIWHANGTFTTLPVCDNVTNVTATPITTTKTSFCWNSVSTYAFVRLQYREDVPGSSFSNIGGMGVFSPTLCKDKNGLTPGLTYRVMWRTWCNLNGGPYRSPQWDGPVTWYQPTSIRVEVEIGINNLEVYPNPIRDVFNVEFTSEIKQSIEIRVVNLLGEIIFRENLENFEGEYTHSFNLSEYSKGIYLLELDTDAGLINKKLILQ